MGPALACLPAVSREDAERQRPLARRRIPYDKYAHEGVLSHGSNRRDPCRHGPATSNGSSIGRAARRLATETKQAFKTTEFWAMVALVIAILIAGNSIEGDGGGADIFAADKVWLYVTILGSAYMVSRGLAKSGSREPYYDDGTNAERGDHADSGRNR